MNNKSLIPVIIILTLIIVGTIYYFTFWQKEDTSGGSQLPNPAAVYCEEQDGTLENRMMEGGQKGFCIFNDSSECGQWEFFRGDCKKGQRFCKDLCGDGICQKIVCLAIGCPCAETLKSCAQDCQEQPSDTMINFEECLAQGCPILESYPRKCRTPDGKTLVEDIGNELEKQDLIRVSNPRPNDVIESPLEIIGEARGYWFFEADFPVKLLDANGKELGIAIASALSEWMTEDFVAFETMLEFSMPATKKGNLILEKDNPSGLPENADELRIPVYLSP